MKFPSPWAGLKSSFLFKSHEIWTYYFFCLKTQSHHSLLNIIIVFIHHSLLKYYHSIHNHGHIMIRIIIYHNHKSPSNCPNPHLKSHDFSGACFVNSGPSKDEVEHLVGLCAQYPIPQTLVRCAAPGPEEIEKNGLRSSQKMTIHSEIDGGFI